MKNWCRWMSDSQAKCVKFDFRWGCTPDPAGGAYITPQTPYIAELNIAP